MMIVLFWHKCVRYIATNKYIMHIYLIELVILKIYFFTLSHICSIKDRIILKVHNNSILSLYPQTWFFLYQVYLSAKQLFNVWHPSTSLETIGMTDFNDIWRVNINKHTIL